MKQRTDDEQQFRDRVFLSILPTMLQDESRWRRCDTDEIIDTAWGIADEALKQRSWVEGVAPDESLDDEYRAMAAEEAREKTDHPDADELVKDWMGKAK